MASADVYTSHGGGGGVRHTPVIHLCRHLEMRVPSVSGWNKLYTLLCVGGRVAISIWRDEFNCSPLPHYLSTLRTSLHLLSCSVDWST